MTDEKGFALERVPDKDELKQILRNGIESLLKEESAAIKMRYFQEMDMGEIARIQKVNENIIKERLKKGRESIRQVLEKYELENNVELEYSGIVPVLLWFFREERLEKGISLTAKIEEPKNKRKRDLLIKRISIVIIIAVIISSVWDIVRLVRFYEGERARAYSIPEDIITVDLNDYVVIDVSGYEPYGYVSGYHIDFERLAEEYGDRAEYVEEEGPYFTLVSGDVIINFGNDSITKKDVAERAFAALVNSFDLGGESGVRDVLQNGDVIEVTWEPLENDIEVVENAFYLDIVYEDFDYVVSGLEEEEIF